MDPSITSDDDFEVLKLPTYPASAPSHIGTDEADSFQWHQPPRLYPEIIADNMKRYNKDDLLKVSRFIRDELIPNLKSEEHGMQTARLMARLTDQLKLMTEAVIDEDLLVNTRIERALFEIMDMKHELPRSIINRTYAVLDGWAKQLGHPVELVKPNLWCKGGAMVGLTRVMSWSLRTSEERETAKLAMKNFEYSISKWKLADAFLPNVSLAYQWGDRDISPGKWWLTPACAARDGIVAWAFNPVTYDDNGIYAVILSDGVEEEEEEGRPPGSVVKYTMIASNPAKFKWLKNTIVRKPVRVLRHHRLGTNVAPKYGLRYDGLYRVASVGSKLTTTLGKDVWRVTITLDRNRGQSSIIPAQSHPVSDEREDWEAYQRYKAEMREMQDLEDAMAKELFFEQEEAFAEQEGPCIE